MMIFDLKRTLAAVGASSMLLGAAAFSAPTTLSQQGGQPPTGPFPVAIHAGTCTDPITEPAFDGGLLQPAVSVATGEDDDDGLLGFFGDDGLFGDDDEGFVTDDLDGDGVWEVGRDRNDDGILAPGEVLGDDANQDSGLTEDELAVGAGLPQPIGEYYEARNDIETDGDELLSQSPFAVIVHLSEEEFTTYLACGDVVPFFDSDGDTLLIPLRPVGDSGVFGMATIPEDSGDFAAYAVAGAGQGVTAAPTPATVAPTNTPLPTETPVPTNTPAPTETPVPTNTPEATKVVTAVVEEDATVTIEVEDPGETPEG